METDYINQQLITEIIAEKIRKDIESDLLKSGERIGEAKVSEKYNVSRTPVREAFRILETEGYLAHSPRCGVIVRTVDKKEIEEIFEIRSWNEQLMIKNIVEGLSDDLIGAFTAMKKKIVSAEENLDEELFQKVDSEFHELLVSSCTNKKLGETIKNLKVSTRLFRRKAGFSRTRALASLTECEEIINAILTKNIPLAMNRMDVHFSNSLRFFLEQYPN